MSITTPTDPTEVFSEPNKSALAPFIPAWESANSKITMALTNGRVGTPAYTQAIAAELIRARRDAEEARSNLASIASDGWRDYISSLRGMWPLTEQSRQSLAEIYTHYIAMHDQRAAYFAQCLPLAQAAQKSGPKPNWMEVASEWGVGFFEAMGYRSSVGN